MANIDTLDRRPRKVPIEPSENLVGEPTFAVSKTSSDDRDERRMADPQSLGLWGFATGTWIAGTVIAGVFPHEAVTSLVPVLLVFAGLTQFVAGVMAFRLPNVLAATAFCAFGAFNVTVAFTYALQGLQFIPSTTVATEITGFLFVSFAFIAFALTIAALRTNAVLVIVLGLLTIGYALSGIPQLNNAMHTPVWGTIGTVGGWVLVASAFFAYYAGMAIVVNSMWKRTVLPLGGRA